MIKYLKYLVLAAIAIVLVVVSLAHLQPVTIRTLPAALAEMPGLSLLFFEFQLPLFLVILCSVAAGVIIGYVWEWVREHKHRAAMRSEHREVVKLKGEVKRLKGQRDEGKDEVLAMLDDAR